MTERLDRELVRRGLARSRTHAQSMIKAGRVVVDGSVAERSSDEVPPSADIHTPADHYVSRGAHKLIGALDALQLTVAGRALDAGASTGGFTQVLLERGCQEVFAVDVGSGQLASALRTDPRVRLYERSNLRDLQLDHVGGVAVDMVVADVSFISLTLLIGPLVSVTQDDGWLLLLVKPQFEVGRDLLGRDGVVRTPAHHVRALSNVIKAAEDYDWHCVAVVPSRLHGASGNREFFVLLRRTESAADLDLAAIIGTRSGEDSGLTSVTLGERQRASDTASHQTQRAIKHSEPSNTASHQTQRAVNSDRGPGVLRRREGTCFSFPSDDEVGGIQGAIRAERAKRVE